jgi:energy-converting hydrogenase Eha subunit A
MSMFRSLIVPIIVILWGGAIVLRTLFGEHGSGAYGAGALVAGVLGAVMVFAGVRALAKRDRVSGAARRA